MCAKVMGITKTESAFSNYICTGQNSKGDTTQITVLSTSLRDAAIAAKRQLNHDYKTNTFVIIDTKVGVVAECNIKDKDAYK